MTLCLQPPGTMPTQRPLEKAARPRSIRGDLLSHFYACAGSRRTSVIVQPMLASEPIAPRIDLAAARRATAALKKDLAKLGLLERARKVSDVSGFVLEVTPRQLRLLAEAPSVRAIFPNQLHRLLSRP
jgi:hypothetical protein